MTAIPVPELCDRYEQIYPGALTDVLDDRGLVDQTLHPEIAPLADEMRTAGIAYPVVGRPNRGVDGVVVVPEAVREAVLREAEDLVDTESEVRDAVRDGVLPLAAYEEHGEF